MGSKRFGRDVGKGGMAELEAAAGTEIERLRADEERREKLLSDLLGHFA